MPPKANAAPVDGFDDDEPGVPAVLQREMRDILRLLEDMRQSCDDDRAAAEAAAEAAVAAALLERTRVDALFAALNLAPPVVPPRPFTPPVRPPPTIPGGSLPLPSSTGTTASTVTLVPSPPRSPPRAPSSSAVSLRSLLGSPPRRPPVPRSEVGSIIDDFEEGDIATTSRNFQSFLRGAKDLLFAGSA